MNYELKKLFIEIIQECRNAGQGFLWRILYLNTELYFGFYRSAQVLNAVQVGHEAY